MRIKPHSKMRLGTRHDRYNVDGQGTCGLALGDKLHAVRLACRRNLGEQRAQESGEVHVFAPHTDPHQHAARVPQLQSINDVALAVVRYEG